MQDATLSPQLLAIFGGLVESASGIHYGAADRDLFAAKLTAQAAEAGFSTLLDYYYRLRYDDPTGSELRALIEALLVQETYFFRELPPIQQLVTGHLAEVVRTRGRARVWSAACAGGEEPLTLAMELDRHGLLGAVEIVATDISANAIARARDGRYSRRSLREPYPEDLAHRYLDVTSRGVVVAPRIRDAVSFAVVNLLDDAAVSRLGTFDAILCRNVLIYFSDDQVMQVVKRLEQRLAPGAVLAVGVSESLLRYGTSLACEERGGAFFYRSVA